MTLNILAIILILGIAYLQMRQGLFSSLVMAVCTVLSAGLAMTLFAWLADVTGIAQSQPGLADAVCIALLFVIPLFCLRVLADKFIPDDIYFHSYTDKIGGAIIGIFTGVIMAGVLLVVVQMLPFGRSVLGYDPYGDNLCRQQKLAPFYPDDVIVAIGRGLSAGSMSGSTALGNVYDDLLRDASCARNTAGLKGRTDATPDDMKLLGVYEMSPKQAQELQIPELRGVQATRVLLVRVAINVAATGDEDDWWRLPGTQFRLYGTETDKQGQTTGRNFYPIGYLVFDPFAAAKTESSEHPPCLWRLETSQKDSVPTPMNLVAQRPKDAAAYGQRGKISQENLNLVVDWVYRIPTNATPESITFRRIATCEIEKIKGNFDKKEIKTRLRKKALQPRRKK
ncbi:MAG: CvpA family protein [Phycisphaerae bacterium]|nr:CvpA family protein [Phycisphaerae bacterium]